MCTGPVNAGYSLYEAISFLQSKVFKDRVKCFQRNLKRLSLDKNGDDAYVHWPSKRWLLPIRGYIFFIE